MSGNQGELSTIPFVKNSSRNSGFFVWDRDQDRLQFSEPLSQLLDLSSTEARLGITVQRYIQMIHPDDRARVGMEIVGDAAEPAFKRCYRVVRPDGDIVALKIVGCRLRDEEGRTVQHLGSVDLLGAASRSPEDELLDHVLSACVLAEKKGDRFLQYLLGMALLELGQQILRPPTN